MSSSEIWDYGCDHVRISHRFLTCGLNVFPLGLLGAVGAGGQLSPSKPQFPHRRTIKAVFGAKVRTSRENTNVEPTYSNDIASPGSVCRRALKGAESQEHTSLEQVTELGSWRVLGSMPLPHPKERMCDFFLLEIALPISFRGQH